MNKPLLSICIPTYNRERYLASALDSIIAQISDEMRSKVEICISDNASADATEKLVRGYRAKYPNLVYFRWPENMGADCNYLKVVEIASGEYCWLFGSDDLMVDGAISRVLTGLAAKPDILLYQRAESDQQLSSDPVVVQWTTLPGDYDFDSSAERDRFLQYLASCHSPAGLFSYLSVILFRNERWQAIADKDRFVGSAYVHMHIMLAILHQGAVFHARCSVVALCRTGNDSFLSDDSLEGRYLRIKLDVDGYREIPMHVFGCDSEEYRLIHAMINKNLTISGLMKYKLGFIRLGNKQNIGRVERMLLANGFIFKYISLLFLGNKLFSCVINKFIVSKR